MPGAPLAARARWRRRWPPTRSAREPFTIADLADEVAQSAPRDAIVLVESVGGVRSPLAADGDTVALVAALQPALVVLVADAELGTINVVRLSVDVLARAPRRRVPQPLRRRHTSCTRATTTGS